MAGQFHGDEPGVTGGGERRQHRREVDLPGAELEVLVNVTPHVVDLYVDQVLGHRRDTVRNRDRLQAAAVPDVQGDAEGGGRAEGRVQPPPAGDVRHEHARLR